MQVHITMNKCPSFGRMTYCMDPCAKVHYTASNAYLMSYCMAGNFYGVSFLWMVDLYYFQGLIFADGRTHAHCVYTVQLSLFRGFNFCG